MNPRRRRHNRLVRKGTAPFQLRRLDREAKRQEFRRKLEAKIGEELRKFVGRRLGRDVQRSDVQAALVKIFRRELDELRFSEGFFEPGVVVTVDPEDPTRFRVTVRRDPVVVATADANRAYFVPG